MNYYDVVIVGSGVAGVSALIWLKQLGIRAIMLEKSSEIGGQLHKVHNKIIDYPGLFGLNGSDLLGRMEQHLVSMGCQWLTETEVTSVESASNGVIVTTSNKNNQESESYASRYVIMAAGASDRCLYIPGEEELYSRIGNLSTSKSPELFKDKRVVIVGGGNRALEGAYRLKNLAASITIVHRHDQFSAKAEYVHPLLDSTNVSFELFSQVDSIVWNTWNKLAGVVIINSQTGVQKYHEADCVLIRIGVEPNSNLTRHLVETENGRIKTDRWGKTTHSQIYAIGDLSTPPEYSSISLYVGQGMAAAKNIWIALKDKAKSR